jgi:hypothetical protein
MSSAARMPISDRIFDATAASISSITASIASLRLISLIPRFSADYGHVRSAA